MLQIHLNKSGPNTDGPAPSVRVAPVVQENVTVSCPDHLVLANLLVAKSVGTSPSSSSGTPIKHIGRKRRRSPGEKVHICLCCDYPISIYGRLNPCEHAFCLTCARTEPTCYLCDQRIIKIQTIKMLDGIFVCGAPHCLRSFRTRSDFEQHLKEMHLDLLKPSSQEKSEASDPQFKPPSQADGLHRSVSAPSIQGASSQAPQTADSAIMRSQMKRASMPPASNANAEKQSQPSQPMGMLGSPATPPPPPPEKQLQRNQSANSSTSAHIEKHLGNKEHKYSPQTGSGNKNSNQATSQPSDRHPNQSPHNYYQRPLHGDAHQSAPPELQINPQGHAFLPQQTDSFNSPYQSLPHGQLTPPPMPIPYPNNMYAHTYSPSPDGQQQPFSPQFDPSRYVSHSNTSTVQSPSQNFQDNSQRFLTQASFATPGQDGQQVSQAVGSSVPPEGYFYSDRHSRPDYRHAQGNLPAKMPQAIPFDQSLQFHDGQSLDMHNPPLPKHRKPNLPMNSSGNQGWSGGRPNFGGHSYGNWTGPS